MENLKILLEKTTRHRRYGIVFLNNRYRIISIKKAAKEWFGFRAVFSSPSKDIAYNYLINKIPLNDGKIK